MNETGQPFILLLGSGVTVLGALRSLAKAGLRALVVSEEASPYRSSRWYRAAPPMAGRGLRDYLASLSTETVVLIPCSDAWAREVASLPVEAQGRRFLRSLPAPEVLELFLDKGRLASLLEREGVPHPRTLAADDHLDLGAVEGLEGFFLKPRDSQRFMRTFGVKAFWPESPEDLRRKLDAAREAGLELTLQEYIPGPASRHFFVDGFFDSQGRVPAVFVRQRLRMHPPRFGNSSYMVSVEPGQAEEAVDSVQRLLSGVGYRGVFSAEFKHDSRDGQFKLLEVNARPWWYVEFAANSGVNFMEMVVRDALGQPVPENASYAVGRRLIYPYYDISACVREEGGRLRGLFSLARSVVGAELAILRWSDPLPAFYEFMDLSRNFVRRQWGARRTKRG